MGKNRIIFIAIIGTLFFTQTVYSWEYKLYYNLEMAKKNPVEYFPKETIYLKNEYLLCSGSSNLAKINNNAVQYMNIGNFDKAIDILGKGIKKAPLFLPYNYNIGICYTHKKNFPRANLNLKRAKGVLPEFSWIYIQLGYLSEIQRKFDSALEFYRLALKRDPSNLEAIINIGNIYFNRGQMSGALRYYKKVLKLKKNYANGFLGIGKILFKREKYYKSRVLLKKIDKSKNDYDKSYHFYMAECSYKLRDYKTALNEYQELLKFPNNRFFITTSKEIIKHKISMAKKFVDIGF